MSKKYYKYLVYSLIGAIIIILNHYLKNKFIFILGIIIILYNIIMIIYNLSIFDDNSDYIEEILMYKKGYTLELRLPKNTVEDSLFREYADKEMIKELDNYLRDNKSVKFSSDDYNYNENTVKKLIRK